MVRNNETPTSTTHVFTVSRRLWRFVLWRNGQTDDRQTTHCTKGATDSTAAKNRLCQIWSLYVHPLRWWKATQNVEFGVVSGLGLGSPKVTGNVTIRY